MGGSEQGEEIGGAVERDLLFLVHLDAVAVRANDNDAQPFGSLHVAQQLAEKFCIQSIVENDDLGIMFLHCPQQLGFISRRGLNETEVIVVGKKTADHAP